MNKPKTPRYGHAPITMRRVARIRDIERVGDFCWKAADDGRRWILFGEPRDADGGWEIIQLSVEMGENKKGQHWGWDGDERAPTLTPSVHTIGHWHGWIRNGQLLEA